MSDSGVRQQSNTVSTISINQNILINHYYNLLQMITNYYNFVSDLLNFFIQHSEEVQLAICYPGKITADYK